MAALKPQDVAVVLYLCRHAPKRPPYSTIALDLSMSASEVHGAVKRAQGSRLVHGSALGERPNYAAIQEFLVHGLKYAFPAVRGATSRGVPTSYAAEPLMHLIVPGDEPIPVWPYAFGSKRGITLEPLYPQAPKAALHDPLLYEYLALVDALRDGRARERKLAEEMLLSRLQPAVYA